MTSPEQRIAETLEALEKMRAMGPDYALRQILKNQITLLRVANMRPTQVDQ